MPTQRHRIAAQHAMERRLATTVAGERMHERERLVERHAKRIDVRTHVDRLAAVDLLRRHVERRADHFAWLREAIVGGRQRQAEVEDDWSAVRLHDEVLRLQVAMHDPGSMRGVQCFCDSGEEVEQRTQSLRAIAGRSRDFDPRTSLHRRALAAGAGAGDAARQGLAVVERQHEVGALAVLEDVEHLRDRRMVELAENARLAAKPFVTRIVGVDVAAQRLHDHVAREHRVPRQPGAAHAALADHAHQLVAADAVALAEVLREDVFLTLGARRLAEVVVLAADESLDLRKLCDVMVDRLQAPALLVLEHALQEPGPLGGSRIGCRRRAMLRLGRSALGRIVALGHLHLEPVPPEFVTHSSATRGLDEARR